MAACIQPLPFDALELHRAPFIYKNRGSWDWDSSRRNHYNLWICTEGAAEIQCNDAVYPVQPWAAFVFPPGMHLKGRMQAGQDALTNFSVHWTPRGMKGGSGFPFLGMVVREIDTMQTLTQALVRLSVFEDALSQQQEEWILLELLGLLWRESQTPQKSAVDAVIYRQIEEMRSGRQLFASVDTLAEEANLSRIHYTRCFRRIAGVPPNQFLIRQRVERACVLLRETNWTIGTISEAVGYGDVYFFSRQFRRVLHQTPGQYRLRPVKVEAGAS